jgi:hypothetical protein
LNHKNESLNHRAYGARLRASRADSEPVELASEPFQPAPSLWSSAANNFSRPRAYVMLNISIYRKDYRGLLFHNVGHSKKVLELCTLELAHFTITLSSNIGTVCSEFLWMRKGA